MTESLLPHLFQEDLYDYGVPLMVVLPRQWDQYSREDQMLLQKILTSVKVDLNAVQMVAAPSVNLESLRVYSPTRVLVFGATVGEEIPFYQSTSAQGFTVIRADDLNVLDDTRKKNLWLALRQMFGI